MKGCLKKAADCICSSLNTDYGTFISGLPDPNIVSAKEQAPEKSWYMWTESVISDLLERFPKSARLRIINACLQREKLDNKFKALTEMMLTKWIKPNVEQKFSMYRYKKLIEEELVEDDIRMSENKGLDVNMIVNHQAIFDAFQAALKNGMELKLNIWREMLEDNPSSSKLQSLGFMIHHAIGEIRRLYKKLSDINPNHIRTLESYGHFLKDIVNDDLEGQKLLEKAAYVVKSSAVNKQFIDSERLKYGENSKTCIMTVSGNLKDMGVIKSINHEITRILGFSKSELIGNSINKIMPECFSKIHDTLISRYLQTSESEVMGVERTVFPLSKKGFIVPSTLMIKVLPDLTKGIQFAGFLSDVENNEFEEKLHHIIYSGDTRVIQGFTKSCQKSFGLPSRNEKGSKAINMDIIFPDLINHSAEDLKSPSGVTLTLDTEKLQQTDFEITSERDGECQRE